MYFLTTLGPLFVGGNARRCPRWRRERAQPEDSRLFGLRKARRHSRLEANPEHNLVLYFSL